MNNFVSPFKSLAYDLIIIIIVRKSLIFNCLVFLSEIISPAQFAPFASLPAFQWSLISNLLKKIKINSYCFYRVNYIAANIEDFGNAFKCIMGSTMNPAFRSEPFPVFKDEFGTGYDTSYT